MASEPGLGPEIAAAHVAITASFAGMAEKVRAEAQKAGGQIAPAIAPSAKAAGSKAGSEFGEGFNEKIKGAFKNVFLYGGAYAAIGGIQQLLAAAGRAAIGFNSTLEQTSIGFETLLGSAKAADAELAWLKQFARETPFQFANLTTADQQLIAMGFSAKGAHDALLAIGDAAAGLGRGTDTVDRMVLALGQMQTKGRIQSQELLQLQEAGVPALKILAAQFGYTTDEMQKMISKGQVLSKDAIPALVAGLETGTTASQGFAGQMERQSHTFAGAASNIKDSLTQLTASAATPVFTELSADFQQFADELSSPEAQSAIDGLRTIIDLITKGAKGADSIFGTFGPLGKQVKDSLGLIGDIGDVVGKVKDVNFGPAIEKLLGVAPTAGKALGLVSGKATDEASAFGDASSAAQKLASVHFVLSNATTETNSRMTALTSAIKSAGDKQSFLGHLTTAVSDGFFRQSAAARELAGDLNLSANQAGVLAVGLDHIPTSKRFEFLSNLDEQTQKALGLASALMLINVTAGSGGADAAAHNLATDKIASKIAGFNSQYRNLIGSISTGFDSHIADLNNGSSGSKSKAKYDPWAAFLKSFNASHSKAYVNAQGETVAKYLIEGFGVEFKNGKFAGIDQSDIAKWSTGAAKHIRDDFRGALKDTRSDLRSLMSEIKSDKSSIAQPWMSDFFSVQGSQDFFGNTIPGSTSRNALAEGLAEWTKATKALQDEQALKGAGINGDFIDSLVSSGNFGLLDALGNNTQQAQTLANVWKTTNDAAQRLADQTFANSTQGKLMIEQRDSLKAQEGKQDAMVALLGALLGLGDGKNDKADAARLADALKTLGFGNATISQLVGRAG